MRRAGVLLLLAGCGGVSAADRALLDAPLPVDVDGAWVVASMRNPESGWAGVLVLQRDGRAKWLRRVPDFHDALMEAVDQVKRKPRTVEEGDEGVATPSEIADLKAALRSPPPPAKDPSICWHLVVRDDPGGPPRRLTFDIPRSDDSGLRNWHPLPGVLSRIQVRLGG